MLILNYHSSLNDHRFNPMHMQKCRYQVGDAAVMFK